MNPDVRDFLMSAVFAATVMAAGIALMFLTMAAATR